MEKELEQQNSDCIKVVLFGPESTGKTTLAKELADYYKTNWVPEYAREYLQRKWDKTGKTCEPEDLIPIAKGQMKLENDIASRTNSVLICDTDLLETKVYSEVYYTGDCDPLLNKYAIQNTYQMYFLTYIDVPWVKDDLRDKPEEREEMFIAFKEALIKYNKPFTVLKGDVQARMKTAIKTIDRLLKN